MFAFTFFWTGYVQDMEDTGRVSHLKSRFHGCLRRHCKTCSDDGGTQHKPVHVTPLFGNEKDQLQFDDITPVGCLAKLSVSPDENDHTTANQRDNLSCFIAVV